MTAATESAVYVVDVCGTLVRDDTTLGLLRQHFASDNQRRARYILFRAMTAHRSPLRLTFAVLEKLIGRHLLKHAVVRLLKGDKVESLERSAAAYSILLLKERRLPSVWQLLDTILPTDRVVLASASLEPIVANLALAIGASHVASTLEHHNGVLTGRYAADLTGNKEQALAKKYGPALLDGQVLAISDNFSDRSLLERASKAYVVLHHDSHRHRWSGLKATFLKVGE